MPEPQPIPPPTADFADWLSPMLVKELRQGVRTRVFVTLFILLQVLMLMDISLSLLVAANQQDTSAGTVFFWIVVGLPVLLALPLNGLGAVGNEIRANTLELTFLTRLTAFRIVAGKWLATFVQSLLLVSAVLPYLVLRYFIGGVNLTSELTTLGLMLAASALLSAFATGVSAYPVRIVRGLMVVAIILFFIGGASVAESFVLGGRASITRGSGPGFWEWAGTLGCWAILLLLTLEMGAARIAPPAENHSAIARSLALAGLALTAAGHFLLRLPQGLTLSAFVIAVIVCAVSLCEEPRWIPSLYRPFAARGWLGRMVGRLLYPGWHTGFFFAVLTFAAFGALMARQHLLDSIAGATRFVALGGTLLTPVALIRFFLPKTNRAIVWFFVIQFSCTLVFIFCVVCDNALGTSFKEFTSFLPFCALLLSADNSGAELGARLFAVSTTTALSLLALLVAVFPVFRRTREMEAASLQSSAPTPTAPAV